MADKQNDIQQHSSDKRPNSPFAGYTQEELPLTSYAILMGIYCLTFGSALIAAEKSQRLSKRVNAGDVLLFGLATHKLARIIAKDWVTSPLRAPFTTYEGKGDAPGEVQEKPRGRGMQRALGELFT